MVDMYTALPQLQYQGKYPKSIVSPQETEMETSYQNGAESEAKIMPQKITEQNGTKKENQLEKMKADSSSPPKPSRTESSTPRRRSSLSPVRTDRGRRLSKVVDSYRPNSPNRRSRSRGGRPPHGTLDRYQPPDIRRRDTYIPPRSPSRKLSLDGITSPHRTKRKRSSDGEMSEGEIR